MAKTPKKRGASTKKKPTTPPRKAAETPKEPLAEISAARPKKPESPKKKTASTKKKPPAAAGQSSAKAGTRGYSRTPDFSSEYLDQILDYLDGIRPNSATLEQIYPNVKPPANNALRRRAVKDDLLYLIEIEKVFAEDSDGVEVYRAN